MNTISIPTSNKETNQTSGSRILVSVRWTFFALTLIGGAVETWNVRNAFSPDGISYLDLADGWRSGRFAQFVNAHWFPVYGWLAAGTLSVAHSAGVRELPAVHVMNFGLFVAAAFVFDWVVQLFFRLAENRIEVSAPLQAAFAAAAFACFSGMGLTKLTLQWVNPDVLVFGEVMLCAGFILLLQERPRDTRLYAALGVLLAIGVLSKAVMLPAGCFALAAAWLFSRDRRAARPGLALSAITLLGVTALWTGILSWKYGQVTFSKSSYLTSLYIHHGAPFVHWQGSQAEGLKPTHPTQQIGREPDIFEFASDRGGTYSPWYDPTYWNVGAHPKTGLRVLLRNLRISIPRAVDALMLGPILAAAVLILGLACVIGREFAWRPAALTSGQLLVFALPGIALYLPALVFGRYLAPHGTVCWFALLGLSLYVPSYCQRAAAVILTFAAVLTVSWMLRDIVHDFRYQEQGVTQREREQEATAKALTGARVLPGSDAAVIGRGVESYWARLAGLRLVSEIPGATHQELYYPEAKKTPTEQFWSASCENQRDVLEKLASTGARVVVAMPAQEADYRPPWRRIPGTKNAFLLASDLAFFSCP
jgi:hypothetical protein